MLKNIAKDIAVGLLITLPLFVVAIAAYNPAERALLKQDNEAREEILLQSRLANDYFLQHGAYPEISGCTEATGVCRAQGEHAEEFVVFAKAKSLKWRAYCDSGTSYLVYSSVQDRMDFACLSAPPPPGIIRFVK